MPAAGRIAVCAAALAIAAALPLRGAIRTECDVAWGGGGDRELRLRLAVDRGAPVIRELAIRARGGAWRTLAAEARPEFRVASGFRRMSNQQMQPLRELGVELTPAIVDAKKWDAFWDAPLDLSAPARGRGGAEFSGNPPPAQGIAGQPGLPRKPEEIERAAAAFSADRCEVKTTAGRTEISFPGLRLGVLPHRERGGCDADGGAGGRDRLDAASAHEGIDRIS